MATPDAAAGATRMAEAVRIAREIQKAAGAGVEVQVRSFSDLPSEALTALDTLKPDGRITDVAGALFQRD